MIINSLDLGSNNACQWLAGSSSIKPLSRRPELSFLLQMWAANVTLNLTDTIPSLIMVRIFQGAHIMHAVSHLLLSFERTLRCPAREDNLHQQKCHGMHGIA